MSDDDATRKPIANPRDLPPPKPLRRKPSPPRDIKTAKERLAIAQANAPSTRTKALRSLAILGVTVMLFLALFLVLTAFDTRNDHAHAPWSNPGAPNVVPQPINQQ